MAWFALAATVFIGADLHGADATPYDPSAAVATTPAGVQIGDVFVRDASGTWIPQRAGRTAAQPTRAVRQAGSASMPYVAPSAGPLTATAFAQRQHLAWTDHGTFGLMEQGPIRIRLYPNCKDAVVIGKTVSFRQRVQRLGGELMLPAGVARYLEQRIGQERLRAQAAHMRRLEAQRPVMVSAPMPMQVAPRAPRAVPAAPEAPGTLKRMTLVRARGAAPVAKRGAVRPDASWAAPRGAPARVWKHIILHHSDDLSGNAAKYHNVHLNDNGWEHGLGYHFVIGNGSLSGDGAVEVGPRWQKQLHGAHCKTPDNRYNDHGVGICLVGDFDEGTGRPTAAQMDALVRLVRWLRTQYNIPLDQVRGHCDCCATACPGRNFPWDELRRRAR